MYEGNKIYNNFTVATLSSEIKTRCFWNLDQYRSRDSLIKKAMLDKIKTKSGFFLITTSRYFRNQSSNMHNNIIINQRHVLSNLRRIDDFNILRNNLLRPSWHSGAL